jgi:replication factor A1
MTTAGVLLRRGRIRNTRHFSSFSRWLWQVLWGIKGLRYKNVPLGEYLAFFSVKYSVDPDKLFQALVSTKEGEKVLCGSLSIEFRGRINDEKIFLIMNDSTVVAQCRVSEGFLSGRDNPLSEFMDCDRIRRYLARNADAFQSSFIGGVRVGMKHVDLSAKVLEISKPVSVFTRFGNSVAVANALIGDKTGTIKLALWDAQIGSVSVGDNVQIRDAQAFAFKGEKQLRIGRRGTLSVE